MWGHMVAHTAKPPAALLQSLWSSRSTSTNVQEMDGSHPFDKALKDLGQDPAVIPFINMVFSHQLLLYELAHHSLRMTKLHY